MKHARYNQRATYRHGTAKNVRAVLPQGKQRFQLMQALQNSLAKREFQHPKI